MDDNFVPLDQMVGSYSTFSFIQTQFVQVGKLLECAY